MTFRREAVLKYTPSSFSSSNKTSLLPSSVASSVLVKEGKVTQARHHADSSSIASFLQEAAVAAEPQPPSSPLPYPAAIDRPPLTVILQTYSQESGHVGLIEGIFADE